MVLPESFVVNTALAITLALGLGHTAAAQVPPARSDLAPAASPTPTTAAKPSSGVTARLLYVGEAGWSPTGGIHSGGAYINSLDARLDLDTNKAFGLPGGKAVLEGFYVNADSFQKRFVGAVQDPSAIDSGRGALFRLYQAYYDQSFASTGTRVTLGIQDLETSFGNTKPMEIFSNGAYAWNGVLDASGRNGPGTYPNTPLALKVKQRIDAQWSIQLAIADGVPNSEKVPTANAININSRNGAFLIGEVDFQPGRNTKLFAGFWNYTGKFDALNQIDASGTQREVFGSRGAYLGGAMRLASFSGRRGLDAFANIGIGDGRTNVIDGSLNVGLNLAGPFASRPDDHVGIAAGLVKASDAYRHAQVVSGSVATSQETNFELTYRAPINEWLTVQPDIQYWIHPGLDQGRKNTLLLMVHFEIGHLFNL